MATPPVKPDPNRGDYVDFNTSYMVFLVTDHVRALLFSSTCESWEQTIASVASVLCKTARRGGGNAQATVDRALHGLTAVVVKTLLRTTVDRCLSRSE